MPFKMSTWSREHTVILIRSYKKHQFLYDMKHEDYYDRDKRSEAMKEIAKELEKVRPKTSAFDIKLKLKTIRNQYAAEKQLMIFRKNEEIKLWSYKELNFLDKFIYKSHEKEDHQAEVKEADEKEEHILDETTVETVLTEPNSVLFDDDHITFEDVPPDNLDNNGFNTDSEESNLYGSVSTTPTIKIKEEPKETDEEEEEEEEPTTPTINVKQEPKETNEKEEQQPYEESPKEVLGKFVEMEMKQITNIKIYNETKWKIQMALIEGQKKQMELDNT